MAKINDQMESKKKRARKKAAIGKLRLRRRRPLSKRMVALTSTLGLGFVH